MAHFARIENNIVQQVIVVSNDDCGGGDYPDSEPIGQAFIASLGLTGQWKQCSYSASFRSKYPGFGFVYSVETDSFLTSKLYPSWTLDENNNWQPPTPKPDGEYKWSEEELEWVAI